MRKISFCITERRKRSRWSGSPAYSANSGSADLTAATGPAAGRSPTGPRSASRSRASRDRACSRPCCRRRRPRASRSTGSRREAARCCCGRANCATWRRPDTTPGSRCACSSGRASATAPGGSTNAIIHLCAVAGRRGITLPLERFGQIAARVPVIADIAPIGTGLMDDLAKAGGVPAVVAAIGGADGAAGAAGDSDGGAGGAAILTAGRAARRFWRRGGRGRGSVAASAGFRSGDDRARVHGGAGEPGARRRGAQGGRGQPGAAATHRSGGGVPLLCRDAAADG